MTTEIGEIPRSTKIDGNLIPGTEALTRFLDVGGKQLVLSEPFHGDPEKSQRQYDKFQKIFGGEHTADTMVVIGSKLTREGPQKALHVYQERLAPIFARFDMTNEKINDIKHKSFDELDESDPVEKNVKKVIRNHKEEFKKYYEAMVEAALCGYIPDLQTTGYLFNSNIGLDETGQIKWFDFGNIRKLFPEGVKIKFDMIKETAHAKDIREKLRIMEEKPVKIKKEIEKRKKSGEYPAKIIQGKIVVSQWYKNLFEPGSTNLIEEALAYPMMGQELESLRRLVGAPPYGSEK